jgi:hypothetical protein
MADVFASILGLLFTMVPCCFIGAVILFFVVIVVVVVMFALKQRRRYEDSLKSLALELGGEFKRGSTFSNPTLGGEIEGRRFFIDSFSRTVERMHHERDTSWFQRIQLWHSHSLAWQVSVSREGLFSGIAKSLGKQDIQTGNPEFDKTFIVQGDEVMAKRLLDADVQTKLLEAKTPVSVLSDRAYYESGITATEKDKILNILKLMSYLAEKAEKL